MIIRNDDVSADTDLENLTRFSSLCDRFSIQVLQGITPLGITRPVHIDMSNDEIVVLGGHKTILNNPEVVNYLKQRDDLIGVHGLWHTHKPCEGDIRLAAAILREIGLVPSYFITPFNEGSYPLKVCGLLTSAVTDCLENFINKPQAPSSKIVYTHSWRWGDWYSWEDLERCLTQISHMT